MKSWGVGLGNGMNAPGLDFCESEFLCRVAVLFLLRGERCEGVDIGILQIHIDYATETPVI